MAPIFRTTAHRASHSDTETNKLDTRIFSTFSDVNNKVSSLHARVVRDEFWQFHFCRRVAHFRDRARVALSYYVCVSRIMWCYII